MVRWQRRCGNRHRPSIERLGVAGPSNLLGDDGEVVQCVGQIRMARTQLGLLNASGVSQQLIGRREVAIDSSMFRHLEDVSSIPHFRHRISGAPRDPTLTPTSL
jgi:hypothetical protein